MAYFAEVAKAGSYSKASEKLYVTRQALSKAVAKLEEETGLALLENDGHGVRLTARGVVFLDEISPLLASYAQLESRYGSGPKKATLRLAISQGAFHLHPDGFFPQFIESLGDVDVQLEEIHSDGTLAMVGSGEAEVGVLGSHPKYLLEFDCLELAHPGFYVSVPLDHPFAQRDSLELADMDGIPFVTLGERNHLHRHFIEQCDRVGVRPRLIAATSDMSTFEHFRAKESALAFTCAPRRTQPYHDVVNVRLNMPGDADFGTFAVRRRGAALSDVAKRFWDYLEAYTRDHPALLEGWRRGRP